MRVAARGILGGGVLVSLLTGICDGQASYPNVKLTGRLQEQIYYFDNDPTPR